MINAAREKVDVKKRLMKTIKFRLIREGKVVGYETHKYDPATDTVNIFHSQCVGDGGYNIVYVENAYITHQSKEQIEKREKLIEYCAHDQSCICSQQRRGKPTKEKGFNGYKTLYGYGNREKWYGRNERPECSCGLDALIAELLENDNEIPKD